MPRPISQVEDAHRAGGGLMTWQQWRSAKARQHFINKFSQPPGWWLQDSPVMEFYLGVARYRALSQGGPA